MKYFRPALVAAVAAAATVAGVLTLPAAEAATGDGSPTDANISFVGRWDTRSTSGYLPGWAGAYVKTAFTGTTVRLRQRNQIDLYYSIDGGPDLYLQNVSGIVNLTPTPLRAGTHTLRVSYRVIAGSYHGDAVFQGLVLDAGAHTVATPVSPRMVEFVGDSITVGTTSSKNALTAYGWLVGERLGVEHMQVAQGGACLVSTADGCVGMAEGFLRVAAPTGSPTWDFSRHQAGAVVINLGTNDVGHGVSGATFQSTYTALLRTVRSKYPAAAILALETFTGRFAAQTQAAVKSVTDAGDRNTFYINTEGWIPAGGLSDSVHPNDTGHRAITDRLAPILSARMATIPPPTTSPPASPPPTSPPTAAPPSPPRSTPPPTTPHGTTPAGSACAVRYAITNQWSGGFQGDLTVTNTGTAPVNGWTLRWTFTGSQHIDQIWNASHIQTGAAVRASNVEWNAAIPSGTAVTFGFIASTSGLNAPTQSFTLNNTPCAVN